MNYKVNLIQKFKNKESKISIIGMGYVGLPLSLNYAKNGYQVTGIDIDSNKVELINSGKSYIKHISSEIINNYISNSYLKAKSDFHEISNSDAVIICVPTPLNIHREPDLSFIRNTLDNLKPYLKKGQVLSLESTTYPGTTEEELLPLIESKNFKVGEDFFLIYSPEREDPGNKNYTTTNIPKVVGGITKNCCDVGVALYETTIKKVVRVSSCRAAEMTKLLENIHRSVNIGLVNELKPLAEKMNIDIYEIIRAASTKPFGFEPYYPGPGLGGHCIPIDPFYLTWKAHEYGMHTRFIELAGEINKSMTSYVLEKASDALNSNNKSIMNSKILILGVSYKKNIDDLRESPSLEIIQLLLNKGANVSFSDPYFKTIPKSRKYNFAIDNVEIKPQNISSFDLVILATDHDLFDYDIIKESSNLILDTRGKFTPSDKVIRA
ncbi:UDP-N-acetyl-D-glucosamine dehydrogenase [bacterium]|nr:UDP-N-acetyl-D-glucosamine dehydrogenase [bacterium]|tara:strand:- start:7477 stop:8787 length:1311 start_codon:yes stop_codon:yes gene_type:complete